MFETLLSQEGGVFVFTEYFPAESGILPHHWPLRAKKIFLISYFLLLISPRPRKNYFVHESIMESIFDILYIPMGFLIRLAYSLTDNYVAAICLFALVMEIILCPIQIKQQKNSIKQAKLAPRVQAIRKKYAGRTDQVGEVLVEGYDQRCEETLLYGKYQNFKMVYFPGSAELMNRYVTVKVTDINKNSLIGEQIDA